MRTRHLGLALPFVFAVITIGYVNPVAAQKPEGMGMGMGGGSDDGGGELVAAFCLTIDPGVAGYIVDDAFNGSPSPYCDSARTVSVETLKGPKFRFDTNTQNTHREGKFQTSRWVSMTIADSSDPKSLSQDAFDLSEYELHMRFSVDAAFALDIGSLNPDCENSPPLEDDPCTGTVPAQFIYYGGLPVDGFHANNYGRLVLGPAQLGGDLDVANDCIGATKKIRVTRSSATNWTFESPPEGQACRFASETNQIACTFASSDCTTAPPTLVNFEFKFELELE